MMTDDRTRWGGRTVEEFGICPIQLRADWDHVPVGPFHGQIWHESHRRDLASFENHDTLGSVMTALCDLPALPPGPGFRVFVLDESFRVVFGVTAATTDVLGNDGVPAWFGVEAAWQWLEASGRFDMLDLAVWESMAREAAA